MSDARLQLQQQAPPAVFDRLRRVGLALGVLGAAASIVGAWVSPAESFLRSYLLGYMFWFAITLGSLAILMLAHVAGAQWGYVVRRVLEAASRNIFLMAALFLPLLLGIRKLYLWAQPEALGDAIMLHQRAYLNVEAFTLRALVYFAVWCGLAYLLNRWSGREDRPLEGARLGFQPLSAAGLLLYGFTMTFAAIDWMMSLDPHWRSTIYGFYVIAGQGLAAFAFLIVMAALLIEHPPLSKVMTVEHLHDIAKLMFAFLILWAYMGFSQGLIYWAGNIPAEITWYADRTRGGWEWVGMALVALNFALPFAVLLSQDLKRQAGKVALVALWLLAMRWLDLYYLIIPNFADTRGRLSFSWMNVATTLGIGGLWLTAFVRNLKSRPLVAAYDPLFDQVWKQKEEEGHGH